MKRNARYIKASSINISFVLSAAGDFWRFYFAALLMLCMNFLAGSGLMAQVPTVLGTQTVNGVYTTYDLATVGGFKQVRLQAASSEVAGIRNWEFCTGTAGAANYFNNWRPYTAGLTLAGCNTFIPAVGGTASALYNTGTGGQSGLMPAITAGNYYTFNITNNNLANNSMAVLETNFDPELISTVTQYPASTAVVNTAGVTVTITTSVAPNANIFVRYTTNGWISSTLVQASFAGTTGTAVIPVQSTGTNVAYYVYSSNLTLAQINTDVGTFGQNAHDMSTLRLNNNSGSNYTYTVLAGVVTVNATNAANDASYPTLGTAFAQINSGLHTGVINITITGNTIENASAVLNASGGSSSYTAVSIQPSGGALRSITGNLAAPLVDLNGADNVTIDGLNSGGNSLVFSNTSTSSLTGTSALRMYNGVTATTVQNCSWQASTLSFNDGVISLAAGINTGITLNANTIQAAGTNLPVNGVYSNGANTATLNNNNIQDYFSASSNSAGVNINGAGTGWTITGNRFFQTAQRFLTGASIQRGIFVSTGGGYTINNNIIGYGSATQTGLMEYLGLTISTRYVGIQLGLSGASSSVQNNTVAGINLNSSNTSGFGSEVMFMGIFLSSGSADIGTVTGNRIGVLGSGPVTINMYANGGNLAGIYAASSGTVNIQNNSISALSLNSVTASFGCTLHGIYASGTGSFSISTNTIGHASTTNAITLGTPSFTTASCTFNGILNQAAGISITNNVIGNIRMASTAGLVRAVFVSGGAGTVNITGNTMLSCTIAGGSFEGFVNSTACTQLNVSSNIIRSLTANASGGLLGISNSGAVTGSIIISNNQFGNASGGLITYSVASSGGINVINNTGGGAACTLTIQSNDFRGIVHSVAGSGSLNFIFNSAATLSQDISSNTFTALSITTSNSVTFISNSVSLSAAGSKNISNNSIVTSFTKTGNGSNLYFYFDAGSSAAGSTTVNTGNNFSNITISGILPVQGWFNTDGSTQTKNITNNTFSNISSSGSAVNAIQVTNGTGNISGNVITGLSAPNSVTALSVTNGSFNLFSNTINTLSNSGSFTSLTGISVSNGSVSVYDHSIYGLSSSATSTTVSGISITGGAAVSAFRNKIYDLSSSAALSSGGVYGIQVTGGGTVNLYNNLVGNLTANAATFDDALRGISVTGGTTVNVFFNTVNLTAGTGGTNFGSAAFYAGASPTVNLRNNILINQSVFNGTGRTIAYRRNGTSLTGYAATSNNNLFFAGSPSASRLIFFDGTNSDQTLSNFQARVSPRDNVSVTADLSTVFLSTVGANAGYLHLNPAIANLAESGGAAGTGITTDFDGDARGITPDIGADEFTGLSCGTAPALTSIATAGPYYAGDVITVNGTNLTGVTSATINGVSATIGTITPTTIQLTVPGTITTISGSILVSKSAPCGFSNGLAFTFSGFITKGAGAGTGNWNTATIWRGNAVPPANAIVVINNGDAVTLDVSADPNSLTINATASLTHQNNSFTLGNTNLTATNISGTLTIDNAGTPVLSNSNRFRSTTVTVLTGGVFTNNSANASAVGITNFNVNSGGTYNHNATGSVANGVAADFPGSATRVFGATSNVNITRWANAGAAPVNLPASGSPGWGNLTINVSTLGGFWNQQSQLTNVQGTLTITATGGGANEFRLAGTSNLTCTINRLNITGGILGLNSNSLTVNLTITTDLSITGTGSFYGPSNTTTLTLLVSGNTLVNTTGQWRFAISTSATTNMTINGNLTIDAGTVTHNSNVPSYSLTVGGNTTLNSGTFIFAGGSGTTGVNFTTANFIQTGGTTTFQNATGGVLSATGRIEISGGLFQNLGSSSAATWTAGTDFLITGGTTSVVNQGVTTYRALAGKISITDATFSATASAARTTLNAATDLEVLGGGLFTSTASFSSSGTITLTIGRDFIINTNSTAKGITATSNGSFVVSCTRHFNLIAGIFQFQNSGTAGGPYTFSLGGNFNMPGGIFTGGTNNTNANIFLTGGIGLVTWFQGGNINANKTNFFVQSGKTLTLTSNMNPGATASTNNWIITTESGGAFNCGTFEVGLANSFTSFRVNAGATLRTAHTGGVFSTTAGTASITTTVANAVFDAGATYEFNGSAPQVTSVFATTPGATPSNMANLVINNATGVTLSAAYNVTAALQLQTGTLTLSTFNLTTASITGSPYSATKMVVTNSTGALGLPIPVAGLPATRLFPVGNSGSYTPASFNFTANSTTRFLLVRTATPRNTNDLSTTDYINNRWWHTDLSVTTGTYTYTSTFTYIPADLVGTAANIRLNRWTGSTWINDAASSVNTLNNTLNSGTLNETSGTLAATAQWVGRAFRAPAIYSWASAVSGSWLVPANWNPVGVPGSGDGVIFDPAGPAYTVTNMPTGIALVQLQVTNNNNVTLQAGATSGVINMIAPNWAGVSPQFQVNTGSTLTLEGTTAVNINIPGSSLGQVNGSLNIQKAGHTLTASASLPPGLEFTNGSYFSYGSLTNTGYPGIHPFGASGTNGSVVFRNGSVCENFEGSNPFGNTTSDNIVTFQTGSTFRYSNTTPASLPSTSGRTYSHFDFNANRVVNFAAAANAFICDNLIITTGTANFSLQGTPGHAIRGNITVAAGTALSFSPAVAGTVNLNSGATQTISGSGTFDISTGFSAATTLAIASGTTVSLQKNLNVNNTGRLDVNGTLICTGENFIASAVAGGLVQLNASGTVSVQSVDGLSTTGIGNIRTTNFGYASGGKFIYSGSSNQVTGNRLPATLTGTSELTIANTGTSPNDVVTLTINNTTTPQLNLNAGRFNAGINGTLVINGGFNLVVGGGGNQLLSGTANDNIIRFASNGAVQGAVAPELYNVTIGTSGGGVDFTNNARINGIFLINNLGSVNPNSPRYATGSTLIYNTTGSYTRNKEWGSNTPGAPSYPHHVIIRNATTLIFDNTTPANIGCGGNLSIGAPTGAGNGTLDMSTVGAIPLNIAGNLNIGGATATGSLILSNTAAGDINLGGNWTRTANGSVNFGSGTGRVINFTGSTDAVITASGGQQFPFVVINKSTQTTKVTLADHVSITDAITFTRGTTDLGTNNRFLTLLSTATKTARVGQSSLANTDFVYGSSDNTGQFIVQRYVPARRAWRLMAAPLKPGGGTHTIAQAWQERATGLSYTAANWAASVAADTISAGFATQITGGTLANGFDESNNNSPSIRFFNSGSWLAPANTNNTSVNSQEGWMLFVRGDRENYGEITNQFKTPTITTLRPRGQVFIGSKAVTSSGMTVVGNPYASAVDYFTMVRTGAGWPANPTYYMWDPYLGGAEGVGAFVALTWNGSGFTRSAPLTGTGTSTIDNRVIPSGAAIMVDFPAGGGTLTMGETDKKDSATTVAFRPVRRELMTVLNTRTSDGSSFVSDGALSMFDDNFSNEADVNDVRKLSNFTAELIGLSRNGSILAMERKQLHPDADTIFYFVNRLQRKAYQLELSMRQPDLPAHTTAFLEDLYLQKQTPVSLYDTARYNFDVTTDAASAANNRFRLVFRRSTWFTGINAEVVNRDILVEWTVQDEFNIGQYEIERSSDGIHYTKAGEVTAGAGSKTELAYHWLDVQPQPGTYFYRIRSVSKTGAVTISEPVKVRIVKSSPQLYVFPNPVTNNQVQLQLNSASAGVYQVKLMGAGGQALLQSNISHAGGTNTHIIRPAQNLAAGVYRLQVLTPDARQVVIPVVITK